MKIKEMFARSIDRDIKGVIKVGQSDEVNIKQELEEYVVTRELQKHFADFFSSYKKGINGHTDKMGVWISGFFGSGKSHFLKILSYLLDNKEVHGKKALDFFIEDNKIVDPMVLADMKLVTSVPTDVVLFNIDSKSEMTGKQSKDAIVSVFLKVFNEMQGFCGSIPFLADLERQLVEENRYEEFKKLFEENFGKPWDASRHKFDFIQDSIVEVLDEMGFMSEAAARNWCERATEPYNMSIENFARLVKEYLDRKGNNHHVVFLVDEIGQYIGDDSKLMLNLQTVTEDVGTACQGKVWIVVTSQQDIDSITKTKGNDFSKIQGRFDTRLSLSSANVDEVIKKRILDKNTTAEQTLRILYEQKATIIKNLIVFNDGVEKKLYADERDFAAVYPFVPYQFNLLGSVLTSIRTHGASGKHLAEGERSMIALFKESAVKLMEHYAGTLIPFNVFYDALHQFLDHSHKGVISRANDNSYINPDKLEDCFAVNVLKTLFMIKYVKEITANIDNITSLMISDIDTDRIELKKQVEEVLKVLARQMLIQKNGEIYVFLTDEEQEINREIDSQNVEMAEVIGKVSELIFEDIFSDKKYRYPAFNGRYSFAFNQFVDERPYKSNQSHDIGIRVLTPNSDYGADETTLRMISGQGREILVVLPNDSAFLDEIRSSLKIEKYLRLTTSSTLTKFEQIKDAKRVEMRERNGNAKIFLIESLKSADIYVNGDKAQIGSKEVSARINDALGRLVSTVYHKLPYIEAAMGDANIRAMFKTSNQLTLTLEGGSEPNIHALNDMLSYIAGNSSMHMKTSMKSLMDRFMKAPYGFVEDDVEWLVAKLFKNGDISFTVNSTNVTLLNKSDEEIINYITKREFVEKLLTERREKANDNQKKAVREVMKELFGVSSVNEDDDAMMHSFQNYSRNILNELEKFEIMYQSKSLPGKKVVASGKNLLRAIIQIQSPMEFFKKIHTDRGDYFDFAEDYEPVKLFFTGEQRIVFEKALKQMGIYDDSKTFIVDEKVESIVNEIKAILRKDAPYGDIPKLPERLNQFTELYAKLLEEMEAPVIAAIEDARKRVFDVLDTKGYKDQLISRYHQLFAEILEKARTCNNVAILQNIKVEADALKVRLLNEFSKKDEQIARDKVKEESEKYSQDEVEKPDTKPQPKIKKRKNISIRSVNLSTSWQIETPQDVDKYMAALRERILKELDDETIINIEF
ncbi:BREX system P-loop protein BrxC [Paenibacillus sp. WQ 127069]|uniref:BREX system P-loop protein BrxC n=1 Tax=Paenibacillus baimaensis TaxID=2982185 RepID=A0ABT2UQ96_9BACL|nr:BREX system P-loop protein BrxC [Paenibacillus sp. WQ 127069]MCU6796831.1 BREX system P-loop protein BrxC [Paenibacillus sp. WQ 127069]